MLGLSKGKFIGGTEANSCEITSRLPRCSAVNEWREKGENGVKKSRGEDLRVFIGKCATAYV